ncbi:MAG: hypothetical protein MUC68_17915 [Burkholderiaceae bacterium]|jgi:hypothetical protein|nr:hypothetical protein [Burkholderiaceae bacterium]
MIPTNVEEGLVNLYLTCQRAARIFNACATRSGVPALRAAWLARSQHCRLVAGGLRPWLSRALARPALRAVAESAPVWHAVPADADEAALMRAYETCEGYVLAGYRDTIDLGLPDPLSAALLPQFEAALSQYVEIVALGGPRRLPARRSVAPVVETPRRPRTTGVAVSAVASA